MERIPKIIHYIWLGTKKLDKTSLMCMKSWRKYLPDYKIIKWDDARCYDILSKNPYAMQAYELKKYAFVSDYLRLYILYHYGGIYMDTDVQVYRSLDRFLDEEVFTSFESADSIPTALLAAKKKNIWIKMLLNDYKNRIFDDHGQVDLTTNVNAITELSIPWGLVRDGKEQLLRSGVHIYPREYFCPIDLYDRRNDAFTENTYAAHLYNGSWRSPIRNLLSKVKKQIGVNPEKLFGKNIYELLKKL